MQERDLTRNLAFGRIAVGASALLTTRLFGLVFAGREAAEDPVTRMAGRLFGVRDLALGVLTMEAIDQGQPVKRLLQAGIACDAADFVSIVAGSHALPWRGRILGLGLATGFAAVGLKAVSSFA
jgi:hypothetical protein